MIVCVEREIVIPVCTCTDMPAMLLGNNVRIWGSFWESMHDVAVKKYLPSQGLVQWGAQGAGAPPPFQAQESSW